MTTRQDQSEGFNAGIMVHAGNCFNRLEATIFKKGVEILAFVETAAVIVAVLATFFKTPLQTVCKTWELPEDPRLQRARGESLTCFWR